MYRLSQLFVTLFAVALSTGLQGQQVTARVAGLESNAKYMSLLEQEQRLHRTEDSVVQVINDTRKLFTAETTDSEKEQLGTKILQLEKELFEIRNQQGVTANEIGAIEQDFILKNLNGTAENPAAPALRLRRAENKLRIWSTTSTSKKTCRSRITSAAGTRRNSNRCR